MRKSDNAKISMPKSFGSYMLAARKNADLSQKKAADIIGVSEQTISNWEKGMSIPQQMNWNNIIQAYNLVADEFYKRIGRGNENATESNPKENDAELISLFFPNVIANKLKNLNLSLEEYEQIGIESIFLPNNRVNSPEEHILKNTRVNISGYDERIDNLPYDYLKEIGSYKAMALHKLLKEKLRYIRPGIIDYNTRNENRFNIDAISVGDLYRFTRFIRITEQYTMQDVLNGVISMLNGLHSMEARKFCGYKKDFIPKDNNEGSLDDFQNNFNRILDMAESNYEDAQSEAEKNGLFLHRINDSDCIECIGIAPLNIITVPTNEVIEAKYDKQIVGEYLMMYVEKEKNGEEKVYVQCRKKGLELMKLFYNRLIPIINETKDDSEEIVNYFGIDYDFNLDIESISMKNGYAIDAMNMNSLHRDSFSCDLFLPAYSGKYYKISESPVKPADLDVLDERLLWMIFGNTELSGDDSRTVIY